MVGKINNNDYTLIKKHFPSLIKKGLICGGEFMFSNSFYDKIDIVLQEILKYDIPFDIMHFDKEIGILLSECNKDKSKVAMELLEINCRFAQSLGAKKGVFHLWGGQKSDRNIEYNISYLEQIIGIFKKYEIELLIENIPCTTNSGLSVWRMLYKFLPDIGFIFDTRFGAFHDEIYATLEEPIWEHIKHIHISDYSSHPRDFSKIRPILHPSEGVIDFDFLFSKLKELKYSGSFTLESPVFGMDGPNIKKLENTLLYLYDKINF